MPITSNPGVQDFLCFSTHDNSDALFTSPDPFALPALSLSDSLLDVHSLSPSLSSSLPLTCTYYNLQHPCRQPTQP